LSLLAVLHAVILRQLDQGLDEQCRLGCQHLQHNTQLAELATGVKYLTCVRHHHCMLNAVGANVYCRTSQTCLVLPLARAH
jgi:hypothetical protein